MLQTADHLQPRVRFEYAGDTTKDILCSAHPFTMHGMLPLKILVVPFFLALITLAARRWGPGVGGLLAGFPVVTGPILYFLAIEQGSAFAAMAAKGSLVAVVACVGFGIVFSLSALRFSWESSLLLGWTGWLVIAGAFAVVPVPLPLFACVTVAMLAAWLGRRVVSVQRGVAPAGSALPRSELLARMVAGALLVLIVTTIASVVGTQWAGLMAMFPVLGSVLGVFSLRRNGPLYVAQLFRGMFLGFISFATFCTTVSLLLREFSPAQAFGLSALTTILVQGIVYWAATQALVFRDANDSHGRN